MLKRSQIIKRQGSNLPHWEIPGGTYAVMFRLADSLPASKLKAWREEKEGIVRTAETIGRPLYPDEQARVDFLESEAMQEWLDAGHGSCALREPGCAQILADAMRFFDGTRLDLAAWCVMPNHAHAVLRPREGFSLASVMQSWKGYSARGINQLLRREGAFWQPEPYDHLIRDHADFRRQVKYVLDNPAKANLRDWPWVGSNEQFKWS